jgi:P27 family predicted phage terminase small subunit
MCNGGSKEMAMPAKKAELHVLTGTKSQTKPEEPPKIRAGRPKPPAHLSEDARAEWKRVSKILGARGTETPGDYGVLALYCEINARWVEAKKQLEIEGLQIETTLLDSNGKTFTKTVNNPVLKIVESCEARLLALTKSLGLTPDTREKVKPAAPAKDKTEFSPGTLGYLRKQKQEEGK